VPGESVEVLADELIEMYRQMLDELNRVNSAVLERLTKTRGHLPGAGSSSTSRG